MPSAHRPHCGGASCPPEVKPIVTAVSTVGRSLLSVVAKWAGHEQPTGKIVPVHKRGNPWVEVPFHRPAMQQCASILSYSVMLRIRVLQGSVAPCLFRKMLCAVGREKADAPVVPAPHRYSFRCTSAYWHYLLPRRRAKLAEA